MGARLHQQEQPKARQSAVREHLDQPDGKWQGDNQLCVHPGQRHPLFGVQGQMGANQPGEGEANHPAGGHDPNSVGDCVADHIWFVEFFFLIIKN